MTENNDNKVPVEMFMRLAENAKYVNTYASLGFSAQQNLLEKFIQAKSGEEEKKLLEEMRK